MSYLFGKILKVKEFQSLVVGGRKKTLQWSTFKLAIATCYLYITVGWQILANGKGTQVASSLEQKPKYYLQKRGD